MSTLKSSVPLVDAEDLPARFPTPAQSVIAPAVKDQREALIIYTSGTTGRPKGCIISNHSCFAAGQNYASIGGRLSLEEERERLYVPLPSFHMNATILALNAVIETRGCLVMPDRFHPSDWWSELCDTRATAVHYLGIIPLILLKAPPHPDETRHHVKFGLGAGVDPVLHKAFEERFGFPLVEVWGMTETSRFIADNFEPRRIDTRAFGKPHPPLEVRVVDEQDQPVPAGNWASCSCVARVRILAPVSSRATSRMRLRPRRRGAAGGFTPATSSRRAATACSTSLTGARTSSVAAARIFPPQRSRRL